MAPEFDTSRQAGTKREASRVRSQTGSARAPAAGAVGRAAESFDRDGLRFTAGRLAPGFTRDDERHGPDPKRASWGLLGAWPSRAPGPATPIGLRPGAKRTSGSRARSLPRELVAARWRG
jgi:hypothetical protein